MGEDRWFAHSGDMGDIIYSLPAIRAAGGGKLYLFHSPGKTTHGLNAERAASLRSLLITQPYIQDVIWCPEGHEDHDLNGFRHHYYGQRTLADCHLSTLGLGPDHRSKAWLDVEPDDSPYAVVFARSPRYQNDTFDWRRIIARYQGKACFIGSTAEWEQFVQKFGHVPYRPTTDLLAAARTIAAAQLFVGNQSCPEAIAEGLKKNKILEVSQGSPNSCMFKRLGAVYSIDRFFIELPDV